MLGFYSTVHCRDVLHNSAPDSLASWKGFQTSKSKDSGGDRFTKPSWPEIRNRGLLAACVQETWRTGKDTLENGGCLLFLSGLMEMKRNRGEQGVGIALSEQGVAAKKEAGSVLHNDFGGRIIVIRLQL